MSAMQFLVWVRGPGLQWSVAILIAGVLLRMFEILSLGRRPDLSEPRTATRGSGWRTVVMRSIPPASVFRTAPALFILGYLFHLGLLASVALFVPHLELLRRILGLAWPGLPSPLVDAAALVALVALLMVLVYRLRDPVRRRLSTVEDYLVWALTFVPLATGYCAFHHLLLPYTAMLAVHILSVELLLAAVPFTKLSHAYTLLLARWYAGAIAARKGVVT
ncbi:MAG TPA: nitrate reductase [Burkholderiaceae bacterium]|nr:nitrate reductase [Burkholderiaceae bacterium]